MNNKQPVSLETAVKLLRDYYQNKYNSQNEQDGGNQEQTGGSIYNYITNPSTGIKISIYDVQGKNILKNYIKLLNNY